MTLLVQWELLPGLRASYTEEEALESSYVFVTSTLGARSVESATAVFEVHPKVIDFDTLISELDRAPDSQRRSIAVARAGLGAPLEPHKRFVERIGECAFDQDCRVREGALWAMTYAEWPVFRGVLRTVASEDDDLYLRDFAQETLESFDALGVGEQ